MTAPTSRDRASVLGAILVLLTAPLLLLGPCLFGNREFIPYDLAQFPPVQTKLTDAELAAMTGEQNTDVTETPAVFLPEIEFTQQELREGRLPHWNPYARAGAPLLATSVVGLLYPLNWPCLLYGDAAEGLALNAWLAMAIAGLLMFGFLRTIRLPILAAMFGGLMFQYSGTLFANLHFYQRAHALVWLPGLLWAALRMQQTLGHGRVPAMLGFSLALAMTWLAGFPPYAAPVTLVAGLYLATLCIRQWRQESLRSALGLSGIYTSAVALGFGLAAVQLLPMFAFFPESNRTVSPTLDSIAAQTFDVAGMLGFVLPSPFGHPNLTAQMPYEHSPLPLLLFTQESWTVSPTYASYPLFPPRYNYIEFTVFPGTLTLLLAAAGAFFRGWRFWVFAVVCGGFLLALATGAWPIRGLYTLPGIRNVPASRFIGPLAVLVSALAAMGLASITWSPKRRHAWALAGVAFALAAACGGAYYWLEGADASALYAGWQDDILEYYRRNPGLANVPDAAAAAYVVVNGKSVLPVAQQLLLENFIHVGVAALLAGLWFAVKPWCARNRGWQVALQWTAILGSVGQLAWLAHPVAGGREMPHSHQTEIHEFLREQRDQHRASGGFMVTRGAKQPQFPVQLPTCTLVPYRIRDLNIYTFTDNRSHHLFSKLYGPSQLFRDYWVASLPDDERLAHPLLDFLGVRFVLSTTPLEHAGQRVGPKWQGPQGEFFVYERESAMARAFVVPTATTLDSEEEVINAMVATDFDPKAAVLLARDQLTDEQTTVLRGTAKTPDPLAAKRSVRFIRDNPTDVLIEVDEGAPGYLVLTDTLMSGWTATVNGEATPILRGNLFVRAVPIPGHAVQVRFAYETPRLVLGAVVALGTGGVMLLLLLSFLTSRPRPALSTNPT